MNPIDNQFGENPDTDATITLGKPLIEIVKIAFAKTEAAYDETLEDPRPLHPEYVHSLYLNSSSHSVVSGNLGGWGKGLKIVDPEWMNGRAESENYPACFTRDHPMFLSVCLAVEAEEDLPGSLTFTPAWDGAETSLPQTVYFTYPEGAKEHWIDIETDAILPDEVRKLEFELQWEASVQGCDFAGPTITKHGAYVIYAHPLSPDYDSEADVDPGVPTTEEEGTLSGTPQRMDKIMSILGGRHDASTADDLEDILWLLHKGLNDSTPPYFDGGHDEFITEDGTYQDSDTRALPLEDQWLMWVMSISESVKNSNGKHNHWNDASCIGHVQLLKTMAAAAGIFIRRAWILPHTTRFPDGTNVTVEDRSLYLLGQSVEMYCYELGMLAAHDCVGYQIALIPDPRNPSTRLPASPKLMEPGASFENFEACTRTPGGRFLPGGYATASCPAEFTANKGFGSALEVLRWWANTSRSNFGKRFMAWFCQPDETTFYFFDVNGAPYTSADYVKIRDGGNELPPP